MKTLNPSEMQDLKSIEKCRSIHKEIMDFGVNDMEIIKIIELLSLELENTDYMRSISNAIKLENKDLQKEEKLIL